MCTSSILLFILNGCPSYFPLHHTCGSLSLPSFLFLPPFLSRPFPLVSRVIPTIHLVIATSSNSFELQWSFNGDVAQVSRYIIYVATPSAPATAILRKEWSARAVSRTDVSSPALLPYTEYLVSVHVQYLESGLVVPSEFRSVRTGVAAPLDPPRNFTIKPGQDKTIELTWQVRTWGQGGKRMLWDS